MKFLNFRYIFYTIFLSALIISCTEGDDLINPIEDRDAYLGTWNVNETCSRDVYTVVIEKDPTNSSQVIIKNFWLIGYQEKPPYAIVAGSTITIPQQSMCDDGSNIVSGSGSLVKNDITWDYTVNDGADLYKCNATYSNP